MAKYRSTGLFGSTEFESEDMHWRIGCPNCATIKADLARKVIEAATSISIDQRYSGHIQIGYSMGRNEAVAAIQRLLKSEGVDIQGDSNG